MKKMPSNCWKMGEGEGPVFEKWYVDRKELIMILIRDNKDMFIMNLLGSLSKGLYVLVGVHDTILRNCQHASHMEEMKLTYRVVQVLDLLHQSKRSIVSAVPNVCLLRDSKAMLGTDATVMLLHPLVYKRFQ
jgi:hypothetical protein